MTAPIAIQPPHIDPGIFQRSSGGGESGLEPLIAALQFYKKSKLEEQKNQIDAVRAGSEANFQSAYAERLRADVKTKQDAQDAWDKTVSTAPAPLQPFLKLLNGLQGLDPELQRVAAPILAKQIPGFSQAADPHALTQMSTFMHLGLPLEISAHLSGVAVRDIADKNPADPNAIPLPKNFLSWKYTPPTVAGSNLSRELRAQGLLVSHAKQDTDTINREVRAQMQQIAEDAWRTGNPKAPAPLVPPKYDPNDPNQVKALHAYMTQHHLYDRLNINAQTRAAAEQRIHATAMGEATSPANPAADQLQQVIDLMSRQQSDSTPQQ